MRTISTDDKNDLYLTPSNSVAVSSDIQAIMDTCEYTVQTVMGELILQGDVGIPNFQLIWNGNPNIPQAENAIREAIMLVNGVTGATELSAFVENNVLKYNATIQTIYGEAQLGL